MIDVKSKHITVIGAARSGISVALLVAKKGANVFLSEYAKIHDEHKSQLDKAGIAYEENGHSEKALECDFAIISPGVPSDVPIVLQLMALEKDVFSELEVASWFCKGKIIAVTGSNGKTTVSTWIADVLRVAGKSYFFAGNVGVAFSSIVDQTTEDCITVLEVSSFQLDHVRWFKPDIAVLLNITPDHLDRYQHRLDLYARAKFKIFENLDDRNALVYGFDDSLIRSTIEKAEKKGKRVRFRGFSLEHSLPNGISVVDNTLFFFEQGQEQRFMGIEEIGLPGNHNIANGLATAMAARLAEIEDEFIRESLSTFKGVEHRLEFVRNVDGVRWINDSKATNVNAVWVALDSFTMPLVLILGGRDKGNDYKELESQLREKVHTIIAIGESQDKIESQLKAILPNIIKAPSLENAVQLAKKKAKKGESVLLSPACSSFDMFKNYEDRGEQFKRLVHEL